MTVLSEQQRRLEAECGAILEMQLRYPDLGELHCIVCFKRRGYKWRCENNHFLRCVECLPECIQVQAAMMIAALGSER